MPELIDLYDGRPLIDAEALEPEAPDPHCDRCKMHENAVRVCMPPVKVATAAPGRPLLVVLSSPSLAAARAGFPLVGATGNYLTKRIQEHWKGPVVIDHGMKCPVGRRRVHTSYPAKCAPYLAKTFQGANPERVLTFGNLAAKTLLGRTVHTHANRRSYTWAGGIPVFMLPDPLPAIQNRFIRKRFEADVAWAMTASPPKAPLGAPVWVADSSDDTLFELFEWAGDAPWLAFDVETYGEMFTSEFTVLSVALAKPGSDEVWVWGEGALTPNSPAREALRELLSGPIPKRGQNVKYDMQAIWLEMGVEVGPIDGDTRLWYSQLNTDGNKALDAMAELIGMGGHKEEAYDTAVAAEKKRLKAEWKAANPGLNVRMFNAGAYAYAALPREQMLRYVARDALATAKLAEHFEPVIDSAYGGALRATWGRTLEPLNRTAVKLERNGVAINQRAAAALQTFLGLQIDQLEQKFRPYGVNPDSPDQLADLLFNDLDLPVVLWTETGNPSTAKAALTKLEGYHPLVADVLEYRRLARLKGTYVDSLPRFIRDDGRIHPSYLLDGTGTGRLSCRDPNLQNQPKRGGVEAKRVRDLFVAPDDRILIQFDYKTLEVRVAAILSGDEQMKRLLALGTDFHLETAKLIAPVAWGMTAADVEAAHAAGNTVYRSIAKTINFGTLYGQSAYMLAAQIGCAVEEAEAAQRAILGQFVRLKEWIGECTAYTEKHGDAWTMWDGQRARRRLLLPAGYAGSSKSWKKQRGNAIRSSFNTPIQGTASDYMLMSLVAIQDWLEQSGIPAQQVLTVHDSVLLECDDHQTVIDDVLGNVQRLMESWPSAGVRLGVDAEIGKEWGSMKGVKL